MDHEFGVILCGGAAEQCVIVTARTRHLAARAAEGAAPGWRAAAVTARWEIVGRCQRCGSILFGDERARPVRQGMRCLEC